MTALAGLAILHGCIAAAFIEALLRAWRVQAPGLRLALRVVALVAPFVSIPLAHAARPVRQSFSFQETWLIYSGTSWDNLRLAGVPVSVAVTLLLAAVGLVLFARDTLPFLADRIRRPQEDTTGPLPDGAAARIDAALERAGAPAPRGLAVVLVRDHAAVLYCSGVDHPVLSVSTGTLDVLDDEELVAAIAHELEHARRHDPAWGWVLIVVRVLQAFNPATQIVGRQVVEEIEHRADRAVAESGRGLPLARAIARLSGSGDAHSDLVVGDAGQPAFRALAARAANRATTARCARLLDTTPDPWRGSAAWPAAFAAAALTALLSFVA